MTEMLQLGGGDGGTNGTGLAGGGFTSEAIDRPISARRRTVVMHDDDGPVPRLAAG